ncbi:MAG: NAD(P)H-dependent oxidoreductase subunit E [Burkholderiaceae bacterium]|nr:NAD(P)H-dependent oxidoreductase subunit E [Burkholderiaceae bacterium]
MNFDSAALDKLLTRHGRDAHALVQILRDTQALIGWLPRDMLGAIAGQLQLSVRMSKASPASTASSTPSQWAATVCCSATTSPTTCWAARL